MILVVDYMISGETEDSGDVEIVIEDGEGSVLYSQSVSKKRTLCRFYQQGRCQRDDCPYSHGLADQTVDPVASLTWRALSGDTELFSGGKEGNLGIYTYMLGMTQACQNCLAGTCTMGWNCRSGVPLQASVLCEADLVRGDCSLPTAPTVVNEEYRSKWGQPITVSCSRGMHITSLGIPPYYETLEGFLRTVDTPSPPPETDYYWVEPRTGEETVNLHLEEELGEILDGLDDHIASSDEESVEEVEQPCGGWESEDD